MHTKLAVEIRGSSKKNFEKEKLENSQRVSSSLSNYCVAESTNVASCLAKFLCAECMSYECFGYFTFEWHCAPIIRKNLDCLYEPGVC